MNRHLMRAMLSIMFAACLLFGSAACAQTYASLADMLGEGVGLCYSCGGKTEVKIDDSMHSSICWNENCNMYGAICENKHYASCIDENVCGVCGAIGAFDAVEYYE